MEELTPEQEARKRLVWWNDQIVVITREGFEKYIKEYGTAAKGFLEMLETSKQLAEDLKRMVELIELEKIFDCVEKQKVNLN